MMQVGEYSEYRWGGESSLSSLQWTPWALYGASYMFGTHHLKQLPSQQQIHWHYVGLRMGPNLKGAFGQLPLCRHYSRPLGIHLYKCFRAASTLSSLEQTLYYRVELQMRPAWTSVWGSFHTIVTRSDP